MKNWKIFLFGFVLFSKKSFPIPQLLDEVAAIVNTDTILKSDIDELMIYMNSNIDLIDKRSLKSNLSRYEVLERLIMDQIILKIGKETRAQISDKQIDHAIASIAKKNGVNLSQIKQYLKCNNISYLTYRNKICKELLIPVIVNNEIYRRVVVFPQEIEMLLKQEADHYCSSNSELNLSHILIPLPKNPTEDLFLKIENLADFIVKQAKNGEALSKLVSTYSSANLQILEDKQGLRNVQNLFPTFSQVFNMAKKGDIIGPIRSDVGFHILKVNDTHSQNKNVFAMKVHIRHILLRPSSIMTDNQACMKLKTIADSIKRKKISFSYAVRKFSQDLYSNNYGGDLGWLPLSVYDPIICNTLINMKKGQISKPIRSSLGWHLIELLDTCNIDKETQREYAYRILFNQKLIKESAVWMKEKRTNTYVKILRN